MSDGGTGNSTEVGHTLLQLIGRQDTDSYCNYRHATQAFYETTFLKRRHSDLDPTKMLQVIV